jgi:hypothetical protein
LLKEAERQNVVVNNIMTPDGAAPLSIHTPVLSAVAFGVRHLHLDDTRDLDAVVNLVGWLSIAVARVEADEERV